MLFGSKTAIVFVKAKGFDFYDKNGKTSFYFAYPPETLNHLEVINEAALSGAIGQFAQHNAIKPQAVLVVLSDEVTFSKNIVTDDPQEVKQVVQAFIEEVPFESVAHLTAPMQHGVHVIATNKKLYESIAKVFTQLQFNVTSVVPLAVFENRDTNSSLTKQDINQIQNQHSLVSMHNLQRVGNFLTDAEKSVSPERSGGAKKYISKLVIIGVVCMLLGGLVIGGYHGVTKTKTGSRIFAVITSRLSKPKQPQLKTNTKPSTTPIAEENQGTQSAGLLAQLSKDTILISVINGSGIVGQAGRIRTSLESAGYINIQTGNSARPVTSGSTVTFADTVPEEIRKEVTALVAKIVADISTQQATESGEFAVRIITSR